MLYNSRWPRRRSPNPPPRQIKRSPRKKSCLPEKKETKVEQPAKKEKKAEQPEKKTEENFTGRIIDVNGVGIANVTIAPATQTLHR